MDSLNCRLKHVIAQLLSAEYSSSTSEMSFGSLLGEEGLRSAVVQRAFGLLCCMASRSKLMEDIDHTLQELHLLALDIDLSKELQTLARMEQQLCTILHLPRKEETSAFLKFTAMVFLGQVQETEKLFSTPDADMLPAHSVTGVDDHNELLVLIYSSVLRVLSFDPAGQVVGRRLGQCAIEELQNIVEKTKGKRAGFSFDTKFEDLKEYDVAAASAEGSRLRTEFLEEAQLQPPKVLRVMDCQATCLHGQVVLRDWKDCAQEVGYSAISHTYGQDVYNVFDCRCAAICEAQVPRCSVAPCPHHPADPDDAGNATQNRVISDILNTCAILREAGVEYAWHDGVCIAQHDDAEVKDTIEHIGWIYSSAKETIIFLHYVGEPIAPLVRCDFGSVYRGPRWHTRVWTLQEAALSRCRRYCVRVGLLPIGDCDSVEEYERRVALWYDDDFSEIEVIEEERFFEILRSTYFSLQSLELKLRSGAGGFSWDGSLKFAIWTSCTSGLIATLQDLCFGFPTIDQAIQMCTRRESKHRGDRINSILTLARIKGFVAEKDNNVEASTIEFFARQGQVGLAKVVFSTPVGVTMTRGRDGKGFMDAEVRIHTWLPSLNKAFVSCYVPGLEDVIKFRVSRDGKLEVRGKLVCIKVRFTIKVKGKTPNANMDRGDGAIDATNGGRPTSHDLTRVPIDVLLPWSCPPSGVYETLGDCVLSEAPAHFVGVVDLQLDGACVHHLLKEGESFPAHLMVPCLHRFPYAMLVLKGDLHYEVSKMGVLVPNISFLDDLWKLNSIRCPLITIMKKLIII